MASLDNFILYDVAEAIVTDKTTGEHFLYKTLQTSAITQSSSETEVRGGRGGGLLALIEYEKSVEISLTAGTVAKQWLEMQQGAKFEDKDVTITKTESVEITIDDVTDPTNPVATGTLVGIPVDGVKLIATNCEGETTDNVILTGSVITIPHDFVNDGEKVTVAYKSKVTGEVLEIDSALFPKGWELQLEVPAMDKCTQAVTHKVIFIFDNVRPTSSFDLSFGMGEAVAPEMTLKVMKSCCGTGLGRMVIVPITP